MRYASLPWYDLAEVHAAHDALWNAIARRLRDAGVQNVPRRLERDVDYVAQWESRRLLLGQACGYDVATWQSETLRLLGAPVFDFAGCEPGMYRSFVVVRDDATARSLSDLRGARCVINNETSHSGMNTLRMLVEPLRDGDAPFFGSVVVSGGHERSVAMLSAGEADVAAIDCISFGLLRQHRPSAVAELRVIGTSALAPAPPFVTSATTEADEVATLRRVLAEVLAAGSREWEGLRLVGVVAVEPEAYGFMRRGG